MCRIRRVALALALVLLAPAAHAADAQTVQLPARGWGVEFGIQGASLTTFDGGTITLRHQTSEHASWRYAASFSGRVVSGGRGLPFGVPPFEQESDNDHVASFAASLTRVTCLAPTSVIRPYLGLGGGAGWATQRREATFTTFDASGAVVTQIHQTDRFWGPQFQVFGVFGLEWPVTTQLALHAEYGEFVSYTREHSEQSSTGGSADFSASSLTRSWSFGDRRVLAGVSVFF